MSKRVWRWSILAVVGCGLLVGAQGLAAHPNSANTKAPELRTDSWIKVSGVIDAQVADQVVQELIDLDSKPVTSAIGIRISSPGGSLMDVLGICDVMRSLRRPTVTVAVGKAMSGGALIFSSGQHRYVGRHTLLMLHRPQLTADSWSFDFQDLKLLKIAFEKIEDQVYRLLAENTGRPESEIRRVLVDEMWFTAEEAMAFGLADGILDESSLQLRDTATQEEQGRKGREEKQPRTAPPIAELQQKLH